jgi:hypothetical protein
MFFLMLLKEFYNYLEVKTFLLYFLLSTLKRSFKVSLMELLMSEYGFHQWKQVNEMIKQH